MCSLNGKVISRLETALLGHIRQQTRILAQQDYWESDDYLLLAGILRVQLCDADWPVLLRYADYRCRNLYIYAQPGIPKGLERGLVFAPPVTTCSRHPLASFRRMTIEFFLDNPIGYSLVGDPKSEYPSVSVTPRGWIKWTANKDGMAHFDPRPPLAHEGTKNVGVPFEGKVDHLHLVKKFMAHLSEWCAFTAYELVEPVAQRQGLVLDCRNLKALYRTK